MKSINISSSKKQQIVDITDEVKKAVSESNIKEGICIVYIPHTTAAITINENADPNIGDDLLKAINKAVPEHNDYKHDKIDNNAAAHIKASIMGPSETIIIKNNELLLGAWQDIFVCDFDGPRNRKVFIRIIGK